MGIFEWLAIGLAFAAVVVILRYASRPRCPLCERRHDRPAALPAGAPPADPVPIDVELGVIRWRADGVVSVPSARTGAASLN